MYAGGFMSPMQRCFSYLVCQPLVTSYFIDAYLCLAVLHAWTLRWCSASDGGYLRRQQNQLEKPTRLWVAAACGNWIGWTQNYANYSKSQSSQSDDVFNLQLHQIRTKTIPALVRDLLYADDCTLLAHTLHDAQRLFDRFRTPAVRFGFTVSVKKTEVIYQPVTKSTHSPPVMKAGDVTLKATTNFATSAASWLSTDANAVIDISARISKGKLQLW